MLNKKKVYIILAVVILASLIVEMLFAHPHYHMIWNTIPGADVVLGFGGAWLLILLAKKIMTSLFQRSENYYDGGERHDG